MPTRRQRRLLRLTVGWGLLVIVLLSLVGRLNGAHWFAMTLLGFLVAIQRTATLRATPPWRRGIRWLLLAGFTVFLVLVAVDIWVTGTQLLEP